MESGAGARNAKRIVAGGIGLVLVVAAALLPGLARVQASTIVGAKPFTEQYILAALIEQRLNENSVSAMRREGLGSSIIFNALAAGDIDVYVDYSGTVWTNFMRRSDSKPRNEMLEEIKTWCRERNGIRVLGSLGFENAYALAMTRKRANELGIRSLADLARHAPNLSIAGDYEFFGRPEWKAIRAAYGLNFRAERQMQPEFMYPAAGNEVDVISAYTSDGRIARYDLLVLDDPKASIPPYDAIVLVSPRRAGDERLIAALTPLIGGIDVALMRQANERTDRTENRENPDAAARWLWEQVKQRKN
jgi:osmoprotectant transport system permease protein